MMTRFCMALLLVATLAPLGIAADDAAMAQLLRERRELRLAQARTRLKLLREKPELSELRERIQNLQKILTQKLDAQPEMAELNARMRELDSKIKAQTTEAND